MFNRKHPPMYDTDRARSRTEPTDFDYCDDEEVAAYDTSHIDAYEEAHRTGDPIKDLAAMLGITDESLEAARQRLRENGLDPESLDPDEEIAHLHDIANRGHVTHIDFSTFDDDPDLSILDMTSHYFPKTYKEITDPIVRAKVVEHVYDMLNIFYRKWEKDRKKVRKAFADQVMENANTADQINELDERVSRRLDRLEDAIREIKENLDIQCSEASYDTAKKDNTL